MIKHTRIRKGSINFDNRTFSIDEFVLSPEPRDSKKLKRLIQQGLLVRVREVPAAEAPASPEPLLAHAEPEPSGAGDGLVGEDAPVLTNEFAPAPALDYSGLGYDVLLQLANDAGIDTKGMRSKKALADALSALVDSAAVVEE